MREEVNCVEERAAVKIATVLEAGAVTRDDCRVILRRQQAATQNAANALKWSRSRSTEG